jgi:transposase-like protein
VLVSARRDANAARRFFTHALTTLKVSPTEVVTDAAPVYPRVLDELIPAAWHHVERYANNRIEADHSRLKQRLRPMRGLRSDRTARGHHRRDRIHAEPAPRPLRTSHRTPNLLRVAAAFAELAKAI